MLSLSTRHRSFSSCFPTLSDRCRKIVIFLNYCLTSTRLMRVAFLNLCWHRSIFPGSRPPSIFDTDELNFCVRNGNRWILIAISTDLNGDPWENRTPDYAVRGRRLSRLTNGPYGAPSGTRTRDPLIKSQLLYQLSYWRIKDTP